MRITNLMMSDTVAQSLGDLRTRVSRVQTQLATGKRLHRPSDHPAATVDALRVRAALDRMDRYDRSISEANSWLGVTDTAMDNLTSMIQRAKELAVQGANGTLSAEQMTILAAEVDEILQGAVDVANTAHAEAYLFGGFRGDAPPFALAAGVVTYNGDNGAVTREVAPGIQVQINFTGADLVTATDAFTTLKNLADRLRAGDNTAVGQLSLDELDTAIAGLAQLRGSLGARHQQVLMLEERARDIRVNLETHIEVIEGVDMERALVDFNLLDTTYRTALAVGARILPPSLVDFLR